MRDHLAVTGYFLMALAGALLLWLAFGGLGVAAFVAIALYVAVTERARIMRS